MPKPIRSYVIFTDNSSELTPEVCAQYELQRIMLEARFPRAQMQNPDDVDEFYRLLKPDPKLLPRTSAANPQQFIDAFTPWLEAGLDVFYFGLLRGLSVTSDNAKIARDELAERYPNRRIVCIDSRCGSAGAGYLTVEAAKRRLDGWTLDQVVEYVENTKMSIIHDFTVDKFDYLHAGGRVSKLTQLAGETLGICPLMHVDYVADPADKGEKKDSLVKRTQVRGKKSALKAMANRVAGNIMQPDGIVFVSYGNCPDKAKELIELLRDPKRLPQAEIVVTRIGAVIGAHTGPTILAVFYEGHQR